MSRPQSCSEDRLASTRRYVHSELYAQMRLDGPTDLEMAEVHHTDSETARLAHSHSHEHRGHSHQHG